MNFQMFLLVILLIFSLSLLCSLCWPHPGLVQSRAEASVRTTLHRLLKPRTPDDCPACRRASTPSLGGGPAPAPVRPWHEVKSRRGAPKRIPTDGFACPNQQCAYFGITDAHIHALVGEGSHGQAERIQTFRCQACRSTFTARRHTPLYRLKTPSDQIAVVLSALAEGLDASAAEHVFGYRQATITTWLTRAGEHAQTLHKHCFRHLNLPHLQLDELRTRLRCATQVLWLWLAIDPCTKILPVLQLGPRTQYLAHLLIHSLRHMLAPGCLPLFTSDGLNLYFYALTAHFGQWLALSRRGRNVRQWQVEPGLIYGQVRKSYQRRKLVRVTHVMRLGTEDADPRRLTGMRLLWSVEHGLYRAGQPDDPPCNSGAGSSHLGDFPTGLTASGSSGVVASLVSLCASSPITPSDARAATRARWQTAGATLPKAHGSSGSRENQPTVVNARSPVLSFAASTILHCVSVNE